MAVTTPHDADVQTRLSRALGPKYTVRHLLGRGGFAEVYEVWDQELERRLAVKVLRPDVAWTSGMLDRFRQEARAVARLNHPNILPIHFVGEAEGIVYYAMPFVEGKSLGEVMRAGGTFDAATTLKLARPILDALQHAHDKELLHRDIKPENIMIEHPGGKPLLVDFGIAKRMDVGAGGLTQTGFVVGTPHYMSPEQALGDTNLDARADLYSMGAVLFQMVTGTPPFEGETSQEIVAQHIADPPPVPSDVNAKIPRWLSDVIVKCLAKRPADRFQTAARMLEALERGAASGSPSVMSAASVAQQVGAAGGETVKVASGVREAGVRGPGSGVRARPKRFVMVILAVLVVVVGLVTYRTLTRPIMAFENQLVEPVRLMAGRRERIVEPGASLKVQLPRRQAVSFEWRLIRPTNASGGTMGVELSDTLQLAVRRGTVRRAAESRLDGRAYFAPLITNATDQPLTVMVNAGLQGAAACGCTVPPGSTRYRIGYYPLFLNSTVQVRDPVGRVATFTDLGPRVDRPRGSVGLRFEAADLRPAR